MTCSTSGYRVSTVRSRLSFRNPEALESALRVLIRHSDELVLFGSRAAKLHGRFSDWDVLCVSPALPAILGRSLASRGRTPLRRGFVLDVVYVPSMRLLTDQWLGCELASHVSGYG